MIDRKFYTCTRICAVIDKDDIQSLASVLDGDIRTKLVRNAFSYAKDGYPIVAAIDFVDGTHILNFMYRCFDLEPGDNGEIKKYRNYIHFRKDIESGETILVEQVCFQTFKSILGMADQSKLQIIY